MCQCFDYSFFFFKQKTAYEMRISDWSSDVCSSDLAFDVIVPSLPGFTFSTPLPRLGVHAGTAADLWHILMTKVLGFQRFAAAGADWGARVTAQLGHKYASSLYGVHTIGTIPLDLLNGERWWDIPSYLVPYNEPSDRKRA